MINLISTGLKWDAEGLRILDQTQLPLKEIWLPVHTGDDMVSYIKDLKVRGAPLIGVAAALTLGWLSQKGLSLKELKQEALKLRDSRPTAVNLMAAIDRVMKHDDPSEILRTSIEIFNEDVSLCERIGSAGAHLIKDGDGVLTHCNAGALATVGIGTAIGVITAAWKSGKRFHVYVDETRPLLQGARLTAWEMERLGIPFTLICDNMAATLMAQNKIQMIVVGADRIACNGDFANKIGTYSLAVLASFHKIPFYTAAPITTVDWDCKDGSQIPIEERKPSEVHAGQVPPHYPVYNPAFDVTPANLVSGYILDRGLLSDMTQITAR